MGKKKRQKRKIGYDAIAENYESHYGNNELQIEITKWLINNLNRGDKVLDVGCGTGIPVAKLLSENGFNVVGIDNSNEMIKKAKQNVPKGIFLEMNIKKLRINEKFKAIVAFFSLLHVQKEIFLRVLNNLVSLLEKDGYFIISMVEGVHNEESLFLGQKMHYTAYLRNELEQILKKAGLRVLFLKTQKFIPRILNAEEETQLFFVCKKEK